MTTIVITAPRNAKGKADWLRANGGHGNRYAKADTIKTWRETAAWVAQSQRLPRILVPVRVIATIHLDTKPAHWDAGNWAPTAKACIDGIQAHPRHGGADVLRGDCNCWVVGPDMRAGARLERAAIVLTLEPLDVAS